LRATFIPIMDKIRDVLKEVNGAYSVEGHTDDVPISTARFRSNWELSSARAVSVAHELMKYRDIDPEKFVVVGYGEIRPMEANDTEANRARNRRVEIVIEQGADDEKYLSGEEKLPDDPEFTPALLEQAGLQNMPGFEIQDGESPGADATLSVQDPAGPETPANGDTPEPEPQTPPMTPFDMSVDPFGPPVRPGRKDDDEFF